jgi:DNA-directed RNA polymerase subunit RPC12/RpoP
MPDIHFECPKCGQKLAAPEELATQLIGCPTCKETIEVPVRSKTTDPPKPAIPPPGQKPALPTPLPIPQLPPSSNDLVTPFAILLLLASGGLLYVGGNLVLTGFSGEAEEARLYQGSAIRQIVYAVQYGSGFIVAALGLILSALSGLLLKK